MLLGLSSIVIPCETLLLSVVIYIVVPVIISQILRRRLVLSGTLEHFLKAIQPVSLVALLATLVLLFAFQGEQIIAQPMVIALLAVPIAIQAYAIFGIGYLMNRVSGMACLLRSCMLCTVACHAATVGTCPSLSSEICRGVAPVHRSGDERYPCRSNASIRIPASRHCGNSGRYWRHCPADRGLQIVERI